MSKSIELVPASEVEGVVCELVKEEEVAEIMQIYIPQMVGVVSSLNGYGLAAPQVGIKKKFFVMRNDETGNYDIFFNGAYFKEGSRFKIEEGCLSYEKAKNFAKIDRWKSVRVRYQAWDGTKLVEKKETARKVRALGFQHEIDHCNGITVFTKQ